MREVSMNTWERMTNPNGCTITIATQCKVENPFWEHKYGQEYSIHYCKTQDWSSSPYVFCEYYYVKNAKGNIVAKCIDYKGACEDVESFATWDRYENLRSN